MTETEPYPKQVSPAEVVNTYFGSGLFKIKGGRALYDEVWMADGGQAVYLTRMTPTNEGLMITRRWISWETELMQMFDPNT